MMPDSIPISRMLLERLVALLAKSYARQPTREVKQVTEMIRQLLNQTA